jgi:tight adherence protein B
MFEIDPLYLIYLLVAVAAALFAETIYLLFFNTRSYRKNINRRLKLLDGQPDREGVLVQLRRERGLSTAGNYRLPLVALNRLILQSGLKIGIVKFAIYLIVLALFAFGLVMTIRDSLLEAFGAGAFFCTLLPLLVLKMKRSRRRRSPGPHRHQHGGT